MPTFRSGTVVGSNNSGVSYGPPAGTVAGDVLIAQYSGANETLAIPGWTLLRSSDTEGFTRVYWRKATGTAQDAFVAQSTSFGTIIIGAWSGADAVGASALVTRGATNPHATSQVTTTRANSSVVQIVASNVGVSGAGAGNPTGTPAGYTRRVTNASGTGAVAAMADLVQAAVGASSVGDWTFSYNQGVNVATVEITAPDLPPTVTPVSPSGTIGTVKPTLRATYSDPENVNGYVYFQVATDAGFTNVVQQGPGTTVGSGTASVWQVPSDLASSTTYYWRGQAVTPSGLTSAYSAGTSFTTPAPVSQTFSFTGGSQSFVVPAGVTSLTLDMHGAQGGQAAVGGAPGGLGGRVQGSLSVTPGETLSLLVGGQGATAGVAGYNGGGNNNQGRGAGGGGGTDIRRGSTRLAVAAGGGGGGTTGGTGGAGGGLTGADGDPQGSSNRGGGATQTAGGQIFRTGGSAGSSGQGGSGTEVGGGGGGGFFGGGGGYDGGGGGGSALVPSGGTTTAATRSGNGVATLTYSAYNDTTQPAPSAPVVTAPNGGETWNAVHNVTWTAGTGGNGSLTYHVEVSTNNGSSWQRIGTNVAGTSLSYDFTPIAQTSTALVRVQTVDSLGLASAFDQSNAVFTIQHNQAPTGASWVTPASGTVLNRAQTNRLTYTMTDPDAGDTQSKRDFRVRLVGAGTWTDFLNEVTTSQFRDFAANALAAGNYEAQVRPYDAQGVQATAYSPSLLFTMADAPATPTITAPINGSTVASSSGSVAWSAPSQDAYRVRKLADLAGSPDAATVLYDSGWVNSATAREAPLTYPVNNRVEHVQVAVRSQTLDSPYDSERVTVSYTPPATPVLKVSTASDGLAVRNLNATPSSGQPVLQHVEIWRRPAGSTGDGFRLVLATPNTTYVDRYVGHREDVEYRATAVGVNGTTATSSWVNSSDLADLSPTFTT